MRSEMFIASCFCGVRVACRSDGARAVAPAGRRHTACRGWVGDDGTGFDESVASGLDVVHGWPAEAGALRPVAGARRRRLDRTRHRATVRVREPTAWPAARPIQDTGTRTASTAGARRVHMRVKVRSD